MSTEGLNGYILSGVTLPEEVLIHLASFVDHQTLLKCRLVCHVWRELVDTHVWRYKLQREKHRYCSSRVVDMSRNLPWLAYYSICNKDPYGRNLLKNPCGEESFNHWNVLRDGGNHFIVENTPVGSEEVPAVVGSSSCFVTSFGDCSKEQWIDLVKEGIPPRVMDEVRPGIHVCDWYANRFDCGAVYELKVSLCNAEREVLKKHVSFKKMMDGENMSWRKKSCVFRSYPSGVRYIRFYHFGKDSKFWAGHYGAKITGSSVMLTLQHDDAGSSIKSSDDMQSPSEDSSSYKSLSDEDFYFDDDDDDHPFCCVDV